MRKLPKWISPVLKAAGILNFLLAAGLIFFSSSIQTVIYHGNETGFGRLISESQGAYSSMWLQVAGIGFAILGLGYFVASFNALRNSVALFMGVAANFFGLLYLPAKFGLASLTNGLLATTMLAMVGWIGLLVIMLYHISKVGQAPQTLAHSYSEPLSKTLSRFRTQKGKNLLQLSNEQPVLLIFLRHFGCTFCREALADIKRKQASIEEEGTRLVFVHLATDEQATAYFEKAGLSDEHRISDPNGIMYNAFGLERAAFVQVLGWKSIVRRFQAILKGHGFGPLVGDGFRMPGIFLINRAEIVKSYRHEQASDRPDYVSLASCEAA